MSVDYKLDYQHAPPKLCGVCGKLFSIYHAAHAHPSKWQSYIVSKASFGFAQVDVVEHRRRYLTLVNR